MRIGKLDESEVLIREAESRDDLIVGEILVSSFVSAYSRKKPEFTVPEERQMSLRNVAERRSVPRSSTPRPIHCETLSFMSEAVWAFGAVLDLGAWLIKGERFYEYM